jgi:hypothetical protein
MQQIVSKGVAAALAIGVIVAASSAAQAHRGHWHARPQPGAMLPYSYAYEPLLGYTLYGNCYLVEQFVPDRPYLLRVCPGR